MITFELKYPIALGERTLSELKFRDHTTAADYLSFDKRGGVEQRIALIASMAGTDEALILKLHGVDYRRAEAHVDKLLLDDEAEVNAAAKPAEVLEKKSDALSAP